VSLIPTAKSSKAIALELGVGPRAIALRCRRIKEKLGLKSAGELMKFAVIARHECGDYLDLAELNADLA
jgi:DNA-binding CsgD family transcriptional regulator